METILINEIKYIKIDRFDRVADKNQKIEKDCWF